MTDSCRHWHRTGAPARFEFVQDDFDERGHVYFDGFATLTDSQVWQNPKLNRSFI